MKSTFGAADQIRGSEQSSGAQANIPLAIILEQILYLHLYHPQAKPGTFEDGPLLEKELDPDDCTEK